ncbi:MAG: alpha-hydroxy acid oxidase [Chloroflexota bacterium]|nr:alpha-hydroxy acid oxidase [Chloroflexota bacterium]
MDIVSLADLKQAAKLKVPSDLWDFIEGAAFDEITKQRNEEKFLDLTMNPNFLINVGNRDLSTKVLGENIDFPVMVAPAGAQRQLHPEGELAAARGAGMAGTLYALPTAYGYSIEEVSEVATGPLWFQLYHSRDDITEFLVTKAKAAGYSAICLTVDGPSSAPKDKDLRNKFKRKPELYNGSFREKPEFLRSTDIIAPDFADFSPEGYEGLTWDRLNWLKSLTDLPLVIKGVRTVKDAALCAEYGVDGIVVSNHGGRQIDRTLSSIETLHPITQAVGETLEVFFDSGIRRGSDVFMALALGARGVFVGRPTFWGMAYNGSEGVKLMLDILKSEFDRCLAFCGYRTVSEIAKISVNIPSHWPNQIP